MSRPIVLSEAQWAKLHYKLSQDYPNSVIIIREKMKSVLGFTVRRHKVWVTNKEFDYGKLEEQIHLDFYNGPKMTMFMLKYSEFLEKPSLD
jgi:hypothetical protein